MTGRTFLVSRQTPWTNSYFDNVTLISYTTYLQPGFVACQQYKVNADLLCSIVALQEFTLVAAQQDPGSTGGLRDKPGK